MAEVPSPSYTAKEISRCVRSRQITMRAVAEQYIARTESMARELNTHLYWNPAEALTEVASQQARLDAGDDLPLAGVPVLVKDNICTKGMPTTCGSKILAGFRPPYDAHVIERLRAAGAVIFGKANCDEFAMGSSNENSAYGPVRNPHDHRRVPGGSSGGSAAAVAAAMTPVALGSDTGGSIRQPAAFCGVVGFKPTYGVVSRYGLVAYGSSLDQIGPLTRTVEDAALVMDVISGHDRRDSTSHQGPATQTLKALEALAPSLPGAPHPAKGLRFGLIRELFGEGVDPATRTAVANAVEKLKSLGATVKEVSLPYLPYSIAAYYVLATAEASANLARFDGVRYGYRHEQPGQTLKDMYRKTRSEGFGREVKQRIMLGTFVLSSGYYEAYYAKANRARQLLANDFAKAFATVDLLVSPTAPTTAYLLGEKSHDPLSMYLGDICTIAVNLVGIPAISVPCAPVPGMASLPVGLQLMAPKFADELLLRGAYIYEQRSQH